MVRIIPTRADQENYKFRVSLDGKQYAFGFRWNVRDECWYLSLWDTNDVPLFSGRKVVVDFPLLARGRTADFPPGYLEAQDSGGSGISPGRDELGKRVQLVYVDAADLPA